MLVILENSLPAQILSYLEYYLWSVLDWAKFLPHPKAATYIIAHFVTLCMTVSGLFKAWNGH